MELIIIAAVAANRVIGHHNTIPWHIPEDLTHFKTTTMGHPLIMGRSTYLSIGRPLPGRRCIVVSTTPSFHSHPDCAKVASLDAAIARCAGMAKAFVIGGEQMFRAALPLADTLILSWIGQAFEGDTLFPDFTDQPFVLVDSRPLPAALPVTIAIYRRIARGALLGAQKAL